MADKMKIKENAKIETGILRDEPASEDKFGGHEKVATAISEIIKNEEKGLSIALLGQWGSGKSTILNLIKAKLKEKKGNIKVFEFDAWGHKGDPLRRAFLESCIDFLGKEKWIELNNDRCGKLCNGTDSWEERKKALLRKKIKTEEKRTPRTTVFGKIVAIYTLMIPAMIAFLMMLDNSQNDIKYIIASVLCLPIIVVPILLILKKCCENFDIKLYTQNAETDIISEITQDPEPSSIEFRKIFSDLLTDAVSKEGRKLLIIIDNLDRLNKEETENIWATMKIFFDTLNYEKCSISSKIWLLVPFDRNKILIGGEENANKEAFIDKNFQITFDVPPPSISNTRTYFETLFDNVFSGIASKDVVTKCYRIFMLNYTENFPSPRDYIIFINKMGGIYKTIDNHDEINLESIAIYLLLKSNMKWNPRTELLKEDLNFGNVEKIKNIVEEIDREALAAVYFNSSKYDAVTLLLKSRLENLIESQENEFINITKQFEVSNALLPIIVEILEERIQDEFKDKDDSLIFILKNVLQVGSSSDSLYMSVRVLCYNKILLLDSIKIERVSFLEIILEDIRKSMLIAELKDSSGNAKNKIAELCRMIISREIDQKNAVEIIKQYLQLIKMLKSNDIMYNNEAERIQIDANNFYEILKSRIANKELSEKEFEIFFSNTKAKDQNALIELLKQNIYDLKFAEPNELVRYIIELNPSITKDIWSRLLTDIQEALANNKLIAGTKLSKDVVEFDFSDKYQIVENISKIIFQLWIEEKILAENIKLFTQGILQHYIHLNDTKLSELPVTYLLIMMFYDANESYSLSMAHTRNGQNTFLNNINTFSSKTDFFAAILISAEKWLTLEDIIELSKINTYTGMMKVISERLIETESFLKFFNSENIIVNYSELRILLIEETINKLLEKAVSEDKLIEGLLKHEIDDNNIDLFLKATLNYLTDEKLQNQISKKVESYTANYDVSQWDSELKKKGQIWELVKCLYNKNNKVKFNLTITFFQAIKAMLNEYIEETSSYEISAYSNDWQVFLKIIKKDELNDLLNFVKTILVKPIEMNKIIALIKIFEELLQKIEFINNDNAGKACEIIKALVKNGNIDMAIKLINANAKKISTLESENISLFSVYKKELEAEPQTADVESHKLRGELIKILAAMANDIDEI